MQKHYFAHTSKNEVTQSGPTLCDPVDCSLRGSSVCGILQARILEWVAISFSKGSSRPRDRSRVSYIAGRRFTLWATKGQSNQSYCFSSSHVWMWEMDHKEGWTLKNWYFWTLVLVKTTESPLDFKEIKPVTPKGNQSWIVSGRTDAEAEAGILWPPDGEELTH